MFEAWGWHADRHIVWPTTRFAARRGTDLFPIVVFLLVVPGFGFDIFARSAFCVAVLFSWAFYFAVAAGVARLVEVLTLSAVRLLLDHARPVVRTCTAFGARLIRTAAGSGCAFAF